MNVFIRQLTGIRFVAAAWVLLYHLQGPLNTIHVLAIPGLDDVIHTRLNTSTLIANPFAKMALSTHVKPRQLAIDSPALFVACGLALRRF